MFRKIFSTSKRVGIALSGGGALGLAHIGILKVLESHHIHPDIISGTSMGAIIGTFYAAGINPDNMLQLIKDDKLYKLINIISIQPWSAKTGLSNHSPMQNLIKEMIPHNSFEGLSKPMSICVSNLTKGKAEIINNGNDLDFWVAASASIPGVYEIMTHNKQSYTDGGLLKNLPVKCIRKECDYVIASDVLPYRMPDQLKSPKDVLLSSIRLVQHQNSLPEKRLADFNIDSPAIQKYHEFSFESYQEIYQAGIAAAELYIHENPRILRLAKKES
jgi:NTE family protein